MNSHLETAVEIAREAGALLVTYFERRVPFELKGEFDLGPPLVETRGESEPANISSTQVKEIWVWPCSSVGIGSLHVAYGRGESRRGPILHGLGPAALTE